MFKIKLLDLFSGIGGFSLAGRWCGIETVAFCEIDPFCQKVLRKNFGNSIKIHNDINDLDGKEYAGIDIITGGYPCQPFSVAGSQKAQNDARHLWPQMCRVIAQAKPDWVVCENVYGHISLGLDSVLHDMEGIGYSCQSFVISSLSAGANHNRERVFIVANSTSYGFNEGQAQGSNGAANEYGQEREKKNSNDERCGGIRFGVDRRGDKIGRWGVEPPVLRVANELPNRMDRNKSIGNSVDPVVAYNILKSIMRF